METIAERRKRKLAELVGKHGLDDVSEKAKVSREALDQILKGVLLPQKKDGTRSPRSLGNLAAWAIEDAYKLGRGWFDADDKPAARRMPTDSEFADLDILNKLSADVKAELLRDALRKTEEAAQAARQQLKKYGVHTTVPDAKVGRHLKPAPRSQKQGDILVGGLNTGFGDADDLLDPEKPKTGGTKK